MEKNQKHRVCFWVTTTMSSIVVAMVKVSLRHMMIDQCKFTHNDGWHSARQIICFLFIHKKRKGKL